MCVFVEVILLQLVQFVLFPTILSRNSVIHQSEVAVCFHEYTARFLVWLDIRHGAALGLTVMLISAHVMADGSVI